MPVGSSGSVPRKKALSLSPFWFTAPIASVRPVTWAGSSVTVSNGTNVLYTPAPNTYGQDTFEYVLTNVYGYASATGTVTVTVSIPALSRTDCR